MRKGRYKLSIQYYSNCWKLLKIAELQRAAKKRSDYIVEKAFKFRIYPNKTQQVLLQKSFGCARFVYNYFLAKRIEKYKQDKSNMSYNQCSKELTALKQEFEWLQEPDKYALQKVLKDLDVAYKNFFSRPEVGFPKFKSKRDNHKSYHTSCTNGNIKFLGNKIQLPKFGKVRIRDKRIQIEGKILNATISQNPDGRYYVSICCADVPNVVLEPVNHNVGIDLGIKEFAITSDGIKYANPKYLTKSLKRLKFLQKSLSRKTKNSSNRNKTRIKVARMHQKIANQRMDFLQKLSTEIVRNNDIMCLEDLQVKNMVRNHKLAQAISDVSWSEFIRMLNYKANWYGRRIIKVDKFFPSSQTCHSCGNINPKIKDLSMREWTCPQCGVVHDRDVNAAKNILNEGLRITEA